MQEVRLLSRMRVVDNSQIGQQAQLAGKPARVIHVYTKNHVGKLGDKVLVAIKGEMRRGYIVGLKQKQKRGIPRYDSNNLVLVDDGGTPIGTRIHAPVPSSLRGKTGNITKILGIATKFV